MVDHNINTSQRQNANKALEYYASTLIPPPPFGPRLGNAFHAGYQRAIQKSRARKRPSSRLVARVLRHPRLWRHAVRRRCTPLHVGLVGQRLRRVDADVGHVVRGHVRVGGHPGARLLGREVLARRLLGGLDLVGVVDAVLVSWRRLGSVQAGLSSKLVSRAKEMRQQAATTCVRVRPGETRRGIATRKRGW